jgi:hypothetical protein
MCCGAPSCLCLGVRFELPPRSKLSESVQELVGLSFMAVVARDIYKSLPLSRGLGYYIALEEYFMVRPA